MVALVYRVLKTRAKQIHRIVSFDTAAESPRCRSAFQSVGCPAQNRHLQNDINQVRPKSALGYKASADVVTMKAERLMVPWGYQTGADHHSVHLAT